MAKHTRSPLPCRRGPVIHGGGVRRFPRMGYDSLVRQQFWFWYGYRPGNRTVARQPLR
jgi:hypothetical protein